MIIRGIETDTLSLKTLGKNVDRSPVVILSNLADSSIILTARAWTTTGNYWGLKGDINEIIYKELPKHGLSFPFPQMDIHIKRDN